MINDHEHLLKEFHITLTHPFSLIAISVDW